MDIMMANGGGCGQPWCVQANLSSRSHAVGSPLTDRADGPLRSDVLATFALVRRRPIRMIRKGGRVTENGLSMGIAEAVIPSAGGAGASQ
ncbi:hypothetical protein ACVILK_000856 [Bradyrhizobium embrapense]